MAELTFLQSLLVFTIPLAITLIAIKGNMGTLPLILAMLTALSLFHLLQMSR